MFWDPFGWFWQLGWFLVLPFAVVAGLLYELYGWLFRYGSRWDRLRQRYRRARGLSYIDFEEAERSDTGAV